jgi:hypothetical protein
MFLFLSFMVLILQSWRKMEHVLPQERGAVFGIGEREEVAGKGG